jgi:hypothetical protein
LEFVSLRSFGRRIDRLRRLPVWLLGIGLLGGMVSAGISSLSA